MKLFSLSFVALYALPAVLADSVQNQILAKIYGVATKNAQGGTIPSPTQYPNWVSGTGNGDYVYSDAEYWTSGFFPGSLYLLYQRSKDLGVSLAVSKEELLSLARTWAEPLKKQKSRTDTHDLGFLIMDSVGWEVLLNNNSTVKDVLRDTAISLSKRYNPITKTIRSWGSISDTSKFEVIIDNMMNLELLYYVAQEYQNTTLRDIATNHADSTMNNHFRANGSTWHVLNYNQVSGGVISKYTNQGYADWSTWARGQAWAVYGFVSAYRWTKNTKYLNTATKAADYWLGQLKAESPDGVPYWDFDAPRPGPRDTSAGMIVASGLLYLIEIEPSLSDKYLQSAIDLISNTVKLSLSPAAKFTTNPYKVTDTVWDGVLMNATANNNPNTQHTEASANTGLVYADYYLIEAQNRLIKMGLYDP